MQKILIALAVVVLAAGTAAASDKTDVMTVVRQFIYGFNKGDTKTAAGLAPSKRPSLTNSRPTSGTARELARSG